mgnify:CR=1 FL=1
MLRFSIIIPLFNKASHIASTLQSVFDQTFNDFEIIIVDDGSTDHGVQIVEALDSKKIKLFSIDNQGVSHARNYGCKKAQGQLISFLDADDLWEPNHLEQLLLLYKKHPQCGLYAMAYKKKFNNSSIPAIFKNIPKTNNWSGVVDDFFESSLIDCIAWTSAVMIPKVIFEEIGGFNETIESGEDTDLWIRMALKYPVAFSLTITACHRLDAPHRITNSCPNTLQHLDLNAYNEMANTNPSLHKYLDLNRFSLAIKYKLAKNNKKSYYYSNSIRRSNLNTKQRFLLSLNSFVLKQLLVIKLRLRSLGVHLSSFK